MNVTAHELGFESLDALADLDALCVFVGEDDRPLKGAAGFLDWRMSGGLSRILKQQFFVGALGDCLLLPSGGRIGVPRIFAVGAGPAKGLDRERLRRVLTDAAERLSKAQIRSVALEVPAVPGLSDEDRSAVLREAFVPRFGGERIALLGDRALAKLIPSR